MKLQIKAGPINFVQVSQIAHLFDDALWSRDEIGDKFVVEFEVEHDQLGALAELARILDWVEVEGDADVAAAAAFAAATATFDAAVAARAARAAR